MSTITIYFFFNYLLLCNFVFFIFTIIAQICWIENYLQQSLGTTPDTSYIRYNIFLIILCTYVITFCYVNVNQFINILIVNTTVELFKRTSIIHRQVGGWPQHVLEINVMSHTDNCKRLLCERVFTDRRRRRRSVNRFDELATTHTSSHGKTFEIINRRRRYTSQKLWNLWRFNVIKH